MTRDDFMRESEPAQISAVRRYASIHISRVLSCHECRERMYGRNSPGNDGVAFRREAASARQKLNVAAIAFEIALEFVNARSCASNANTRRRRQAFGKSAIKPLLIVLRRGRDRHDIELDAVFAPQWRFLPCQSSTPTLLA